MLFFNEGFGSKKLNKPESFSELFDVFFHSTDNVWGSLIGKIVKLFDQLDGLFEIFSVDGLLKLGEIIFQ